jgi:uncharacterized membrane protein YidH (DUF202 family)
MVIKTLHMTVCETLDSFDVAIYEGVEPHALSLAVAARAQFDDFFLTATHNRDGAVVPLSGSLPDGSSLVLHRAGPLVHDAMPSPPASPPPTSTSAAAPLLAINNTPFGQAGDAESPPTQPIQPPPSPPRRQSTFSSLGFSWPQNRDVSEQLNGIERLNRLTTDLANERTLLAWTRTTLASIRTLFTYLALDGKSAAWKASITATEFSMATLVLAAATTGVWRFWRVKSIVHMKIPPAGFGRITIRPLAVLLLVTAFATSIGIFSQQWVHASPSHPPG